MKSIYSSSYDTKRLRGSFSLGDFRWLRFKVNAMSTHIALKFSHKSVKQQHPEGNSCSKPIFHDLPRAAFSKVRMNCHKQNTIRNIEKKRSQQTTLGHLWDSGRLQRSQNINIRIPNQTKHIFLIDFPNPGQRGETILLRYIHHSSSFWHPISDIKPSRCAVSFVNLRKGCVQDLSLPMSPISSTTGIDYI